MVAGHFFTPIHDFSHLAVGGCRHIGEQQQNTKAGQAFARQI
jgi:hypothetical protein